MTDLWFSWFMLILIIIGVASVYLYVWLIMVPRTVNDGIDMIMGFQKRKKEVNK